MIKSLLTILVCIVVSIQYLYAQSDSAITRISSANIDSKTINSLQKQYEKLQLKLHKQSAKLLSKMQRTEDKLHKNLSTKDSIKAQELFTADVKQRYTDLQNNLSTTTDKFKRFPLKEYIPGIDSVQTSLAFLMKNPNLPTD